MYVGCVNELEGNICIIFVNKIYKDKNLGGWGW